MTTPAHKVTAIGEHTDAPTYLRPNRWLVTYRRCEVEITDTGDAFMVPSVDAEDIYEPATLDAAVDEVRRAIDAGEYR